MTNKLFTPIYSELPEERYLVEIPTMEKPNFFPSKAWADEQQHDWDAYHKHIAQLKKYPARWLTKEHIEPMELGVHFYTALQDFINNEWQDRIDGDYVDFNADLKNRRIVAKPIKSICGCGKCTEEYQHKSDCAVHNEPAMPNGKCDCRTVAIPLPAPAVEDSGEEIMDIDFIAKLIRIELNKMDKSNFGQVRKTINGILDHLPTTPQQESKRNLKYFIENTNTGEWYFVEIPDTMPLASDISNNWTKDPNEAMAFNSYNEAERYRTDFKMALDFPHFKVTEHEFVQTESKGEQEVCVICDKVLTPFEIKRGTCDKCEGEQEESKMSDTDIEKEVDEILHSYYIKKHPMAAYYYHSNFRDGALEGAKEVYKVMRVASKGVDEVERFLKNIIRSNGSDTDVSKAAKELIRFKNNNL